MVRERPQLKRGRKRVHRKHPQNSSLKRQKFYHKSSDRNEKCKRMPEAKVEEEVASSSSSEDEEDEEETPSAYQMLLSSVSTLQQDEDSPDEVASDTDESSDAELEDDAEEESVSEDEGDISAEHLEQIPGEKTNSQDFEEQGEDSDDDEEDDVSKDYFSQHFEVDLEDNVAETLNAVASWEKMQIKVPYFGKCQYQYKAAIGKKCPDFKEIDVRKMGVKQKICSQVAVTNTKYTRTELNRKGLLSNFQSCLFCAVNNYQDFYYNDRHHKNGEEIRLVYCMHALNHVLKTRSRIIAHNAKLKAKSEEVHDDYKDQGLTRPKVLMVVPFRESAKRIVTMLSSLLMPEDQSIVNQKKRFSEEYGSTEPEAKSGVKPEDYEELFKGNTDDHFRLGIGVAKKSLKLYTDFYSADIVLASPLGLRTVIGAEGEKERDFDFLSSIEILIFDQADVFLMQNWEHVVHLMSHLHLQPKEAHGVDFSRVRNWTLNGLSRFYRQTLIFSSIPSAELNFLFNKHCHNWAGKIMVPKSLTSGSICQVVTTLPQVFKRFDAASFVEVPDKRFEFFKTKILPQLRDKMSSGTLLFIPSYFDFARMRNYFKKESIDFVHINEYAKDKTKDRARGLFYHGKVNYLMYTERSHFFFRYRLRGIRHLIFYELPSYPNFYSELCNMLQESKGQTSEVGHFTCTVLYNKYDSQKLPLIVGTERAAHMLTSEKPVHMFVTGDT